ncbi:MAG: HD domain-containing protein [Desulfurococcaceae archaeon]|nr:HD domain-containing protein [Desulfurococcaceae archaeon]MCC6052941.1 HD domain-containing protein [Desulfurococcaceae archaeon]
MCLDRVDLVVRITRVLYDKSFDHGLQHVNRVLRWAKRITNHENLKVNKDVLIITVFLHDLGRLVGEPHAYYSKVIAEYMLEELNCPSSLKQEVIDAISAHSFSYAVARGISPKSDLGRVLSDADKLDALGVVGFLRVFLYGEREQRDLEYSIRHFHEKIFNLKHLLYYEYSKRVAEKLTDRTMKLLEILMRELSVKHIGG